LKTIAQTKIIYESEIDNLEGLIEKLSAVRANTNEPVKIIMSGSQDFGYRLMLTWDRPMTEEELQQAEENRAKAEAIAKELRREEYLKLKEEFEASND
jgi:hypothetical protein